MEAARQPENELVSLPRLEDLPLTESDEAYEAVRRAFTAFRRHTASLQAQLRVLQASSPDVEVSGHPARMDALHLIRVAAEFADTVEHDAQTIATAQIERAAAETQRRRAEVDAREAEVERYRADSESERAKMLAEAKREMAELTDKTTQQAKSDLLEAEASACRMVEQARHESAEMANNARAEVAETLTWVNDRAREVIERAQAGAAEMLSAAGFAPERADEIAAAIIASLPTRAS